MTEQQPETRFYWVPDLADPIDLREAMEIAQGTAPWDQGAIIEARRVDEAREREPLGPEGNLTKVVDESTGDLIGHAEVIYNDDGTGALRVYGINHNPEEQP